MVVRLKERKDPDLAEFEKRKVELAREAELTKWERVLTDWTTARCQAAGDSFDPSHVGGRATGVRTLRPSPSVRRLRK